MLIGIDIGGTKCAVTFAQSCSENKIEILKKERFATPKTPDETIVRIKEIIDESGFEITSIGISCGGPLDSVNGTILSPPNLPGWDNIEIAKDFKDTYSVPVMLENDANACALAEYKYGAGIGCKNMVFLTMGTGMGAGIIADGRLYSGTCGNAGEVGHIRLAESGPVGFGKEGSFEGFCSGGGISRFARNYAKDALSKGKTVSFCESTAELDLISAKTVAQKADEGHDDAAEIYRICARRLGEALSVIVDTLNPEKIVIGSIYARSTNLIEAEMKKVMEKECIAKSLEVCTVVPAALGEALGDYAALSLAAQCSSDKLSELLRRYPALSSIKNDIEDGASLILDTFKNGGKVLICGNGGSCADCEHIVGELMKGFLSRRNLPSAFRERAESLFPGEGDYLTDNLQGCIPAISLPSQVAVLSAFANDVAPDMVYAQLAYGYAGKNDLLIGLSTSGNSENIVNAIKVAKLCGAKTLGMTGCKLSKMSEICDVTIKAPETETFKIQEYHLPIYHYLCAYAEEKIFGR